MNDSDKRPLKSPRASKFMHRYENPATSRHRAGTGSLDLTGLYGMFSEGIKSIAKVVSYPPVLTRTPTSFLRWWGAS